MERTPIRNIVDEYIEHIHKDDQDRTKHLHITDVTARCPVGVWLEKTGKASGEVGVGKKRRFEVGHEIERLVVKAIKHKGFLIDDAHKKKLEWPEYNMVGEADVPMKEDDQTYLIEVKSIHPNALDNMDRDEDHKIIPHPHYVAQLQMYMEKYNFTYPDIIGRLFYISLDGRTLEVEVKPDPEIVARVSERAQKLHECITTNKRPEPLQTYIQKKNRKGVMTWYLNWKVQYCISDGLHYHCNPEGRPSDLVAMLEREDITMEEFNKKWIGKLTYKAKKKNDNA